MKKIIFIVGLIALTLLMQDRFIELAYAAGYQEFNKTAILINQNGKEAECHKFAKGFLNIQGLEEKFQACINDYKSKGYEVIDYHSTSN